MAADKVGNTLKVGDALYIPAKLSAIQLSGTLTVELPNGTVGLFSQEEVIRKYAGQNINLGQQIVTA